MSIEQTGPKGFEYQYLVTLYMALNYWDKDNLKVYVENKGNEDAFISFNIDEQTEIMLDIQVKQRIAQIEMNEFGSWLAHFEKNRADKFAFEKLENKNSYLIFVTDSRCTDAVCKFITDEFNYFEAKSQTFSAQLINEVVDAIAASVGGSTTLQVKRKKYIESYLNTIGISQKRSNLQQIKIFELLKYEGVEERILVALNKQFMIPQSICKSVMLELLELIKQGRESGENVVDSISQIIRKKSMQRILPSDDKYFRRDICVSLEDTLQKNNILLLTGVSFSGKTYIAKAIAQTYMEKGFNVKRTDDLIYDREGINFLKSCENENRLLLLEDPFGHIETKEKSIEMLDQIQCLINENIAANRKLIITSRKDILQNVFKKSDIHDCKISQNEWNDVSFSNLNEASKVWEKYYGYDENSQELFAAINEYVNKNEGVIFLEIGEIRHLYRQYNNIVQLEGLPIPVVIEKARIDCDDICKKFSEEHKQVMMALGCCCNTIRAVSIDDLAFIISDSEESPSIRLKKDIWVSMSSCKATDAMKNEEKYPEYQKRYSISTAVKRILMDMCNQGYIYRDKIKDEIVFQHPMYYYASQKIFIESYQGGWFTEETIDMTMRAIKSLSKNAAICSLSFLEKIFDKSDLIINCINIASHSIFPAVRDKALLLLDKYFDELEDDVQKDFMDNIRNTDTLNNYLLWHKDEGYYYKGSSINVTFLESLREQLKKSKYTVQDINDMLYKGEKFSIKEVYELLNGKNKDELPLIFLESALTVDEAVVRSSAINLIFKYYGNSLSSLNEKYLNDYENYNYVRGVFEGAISNWFSISKENRKILKEYLKKEFARKSVVFSVKEYLENFEDEYKGLCLDWSSYSDTEKMEMWSLWGELFVIWLDYFPAKYIEMHEPHMRCVTEASIEFLKNKKEAVLIASAWLAWLDEYAKYHYPNDYGMSVLEYLLEGTKDKPELRSGLIKNALTNVDTSIVTSHIAHIVDNWSKLTKEEKEYLIKYLISKERIDYKWIQAVALTRENVPLEVQKAICGKELFSSLVDEIIELLNDCGILEECLNVFCGFPQPLWWNGYHHSARSYDVWDSIMLEVLILGIGDKSIYIALRELIVALYCNYSRRFVGGLDVYKQLVKNKSMRKKVFERLAYTSLLNRENKELWDMLFEECSEEEKSVYFESILDFVELIENANYSHHGLFDEFTKDDVQKFIIQKLPIDKKIIEMCNINYKIYEFMEDEEDVRIKLRKISKEQIKGFYSQEEPRLYFTNNYVKLFVEKLEIDSKELEKIFVSYHHKYFERCSSKKEQFEKNNPINIYDDYELSNWNSTKQAIKEVTPET